MPVEKDIALNVLGQIEDYRNALEKIPGITEKQASKAALRMQAKFSKAASAQIRQQRKAAAEAQKAWVTVGNVVKAALAVTAFKGAISGVVSLRQRVADLSNELADSAAQTGLQVDTLNAFRAAAGASGQDLKGLVPSLRQFPKRLADFARGTGEAKHALEQLGFEQADAQIMLQNTDATMREVIKRIKQIPDVGTQAAMATSIWGESGSKLNQVLGDTPLEEWVSVAAQSVDVSEEAIMANQQWQAMTQLLSDQFHGLIQTMVSGSAETRSFTNVFMVSLSAILGGTQKTFSIIHDTVVGTFKAWRAALKGDFDQAAIESSKVSVALKWSISDVKLASEEAARTFIQNTKRTVANTKAQQARQRELAKTSEETRKAAEEARAHAKSLQDEEKALDRLGDISAEIRSDTLSDSQKVRAEAADRFKALDALLRESSLTEADVAKIRLQIRERLARDLVAVEEAQAKEAQEKQEEAQEKADELMQATLLENQQIADEITAAWHDAFRSIGDIAAQVFDFIAARRQEELDAARSEFEEKRDKAHELHDDIKELQEERRELERATMDASASAAERAEARKQLAEVESDLARKQQRKARVKGEKEAAKEIMDDQRKRMKRALIAQRAASIFQIGVNTAVAVMQALAQLGPIAGAIAAGTVTAAGITQAALVASEPLPSFFGGTSRLPGSPGEQAGEMMVRAHSREAILNSRAVDRLGVGIIDALNAGMEPLSAMGGEAPVVLDGEVVGRVLARRGRRSGPLREAMREQDPIGYRSPFGRN